jgi:hypothetical protein
MLPSSRRSFLGLLGKSAALTGLALFSGAPAVAQNAKKGFIHQVYFWLKNPDSAEDKARLIAALQKLARVKTIREYHIGVPAAAGRDVIDASYAVSWMLVFKNQADQDSYQVDPIHLQFIEQNAALWSKVVVYDSISV